ncbi:MAG TPA: prolyl oligopeptidase family serine peptidase [Blastocatellia bacterium]|nr:prolyl oligopeptidase family serine peptidase [Blastocatellia bacterium]
MRLFLRPRTATLRRQVAATCVLALLLSSVVLAQQKRPLTSADYDAWRSIQGQTLSRDGKYVAYALVPQDGDGEIVVRHLESGKEWRAGRGAAPVNPPQPAPGAEPPTGPPPFIGRPVFTADSRFVVFQILPSKADTAKAKREKRKPEEMPKNALGIIDLTTGETQRVEGVKSFQVPENGPALVAYLKEPKKEEKKPDATTAGDKKKEKKKEYGSELVLKNLGDRSERALADVTEYTLSKDGRSLVFAVSSKNEDANGAFVAIPGSADAPTALLTGKGKYTKLVWDDKQTQLAFLSDRDTAAATQPQFKLYHWTRNSAAASEAVSTASAGFPQNRVISDKGAMAFSLDGAKLFFGTAPPPPPEKDDEENPDDKVLVDLWHWKDDYIQPMQRVRAEQERNRSYRAVYHLKEKRFVQLADETMRDIVPASDGRWALGMDDRAYRAMVGYDDDSNSTDVYLVNTTDGARRLLTRRQRFPSSWSPAGHYALFYDGKDWNTISVPDGKVSNLTAKLGVKFYTEDHDSPSTPSAYGNGGWTADEKYVLLYDRYDIWQVAPDGSSARNLTGGVGRKEQTEFRYLKLDPQEKAIDPNKPLLLRAENEWTRDSGFYRGRVGGSAPEKLVMAAKYFAPPVKAKDAEVYALTASTFSEFPDLLITDAAFGNFKKVSDANPQKANLAWGTSELIRFKNADGVPLSAMLIKPANFDPTKKYPMIVYIYEKLSENLHRFVDPRPGHNINASLYASNGYLVLMPDIVYTIGYPGQSALKCVLPAVQAVVDQGFVNEDAIGIQGHSWGGYQIAYMVTQTKRFKAAAAGAPVANMTSAYSGIRWGTGLPRQFQYEHTQSRIGATLYESPMVYMENSPVFHAARVETPLMMIHNDNDDAVPWYQGIEYYLALRRLGKEVYLFSYNGEPHGLRRRANQKDYAMRLQQYFDHFLKGAPAPEWMEKGIPYLEREREKEKYKPTADTREKSPN